MALSPVSAGTVEWSQQSQGRCGHWTYSNPFAASCVLNLGNPSIHQTNKTSYTEFSGRGPKVVSASEWLWFSNCLFLEEDFLKVLKDDHAELG